MKTVIIGGGAAGMAAAVAASSLGDRTVLVERMDRIGKKLLATGNGRCNLMNTGAPRYPGGGAFAGKVLKHCGAEGQTAFWRYIGLYLREESEGRVYPASGQAATVLDTLRFALERQGAEILTGTAVTGLRRRGDCWLVMTSSGEVLSGRVIVTGGGKAQPKLGSDGSCYTLLTGLGHRLVRPRPALTQLETELKPIRGLSGQRVRCGVSLSRGGQLLHREQGELLFADYGVSGVCVMQCSRWAMAGDALSVDFLAGTGLTAEKLTAEIHRRWAQWTDEPMSRLLTGLWSARLAGALLNAAGLAQERRIGSLTDGEIVHLAALAGDFPLRVTGIRGFEQAQVTAGGIDPDEFDPFTLASRLCPGLHAAGETLDVDGDCGGFNLMFAFGSGILAGLNGRKAIWEDRT